MMYEVPVSVHEKVIAELAPAMDRLRDQLCSPLPHAGRREIDGFSDWLAEFGRQGEEVVKSVDEMGRALSRWRSEAQAESVLFPERACGEAIETIALLRPLILDAEFETRALLLAMTDRVFRDILGWFGRYRDVVQNPESWQGREVELNLTLDIGEEAEALHDFLAERQMLAECVLPRQKREGIGLMGLLAAFGFGLWLDDDE